MSQKVQNITYTTYLIDENRTDFEKGRKILGSYPVPLAECARMGVFFICNVHFSYLQRSFFVCRVSVICSIRFFLFTALVFYLQRTFFICSVRFLLQRFFFCLQRFFFVCSVSLFVCSVFFLFAGVPCRPS